MARPKKPEAERRTVRVEVLLTHDEAERLRQLAVDEGSSIADLLRTLLLVTLKHTEVAIREVEEPYQMELTREPAEPVA